MRGNKNKKRIALLMALVLFASVIIGNIWSAASTQAATTKDYYIKINKGTNVVTVYKKNGDPYVAFTCSTGYATPVGTFHTMARYRWWTLDGPTYGQYCTRITGHILFHSVWYYQKTTDSQSYKQYNRLGTTASHGCCRLTVAAAKWIYDNCPVGTKVIIFNGSAKDDPLGKPETIEVKGNRGWDPTDPDKKNPYKTRSTKPVITVTKKTLAYGSKFNGGYMTCKDSGGFDITDWVKRSGKINMKQIGTYPVTYSVIDSFGRTATKKITYKVVDNKAATLSGVKESLVKERGVTRNMLVGLKAKDAAGVDLTDQIQVYIMLPGAEEYVKCTNLNYTFEEIGTYHVKYIVVNPNNGKETVKKQTIDVTSSELPIIQTEGEWTDLSAEKGKTMSWDDLMLNVTAALPDGTNVTDTVEIVIKNPSGESTTILKGQNYLFDVCGTYTLTYTASNQNAGEGLIAEKTRTLTVTDVTEAEVILNE